MRLLVIDELHNVLAGNSVNRREFLNLLRFLGNELRIPLVGVGTRDAYLAIRSDDQLGKSLRADDAAGVGGQRRLLFTAGQLRGRSRCGDLRRVPLRWTWLATCSRAAGQSIGELAPIDGGGRGRRGECGEEAINHRTLSMADYTGPSERRRQFERELM